MEENNHLLTNDHKPQLYRKMHNVASQRRMLRRRNTESLIISNNSNINRKSKLRKALNLTAIAALIIVFASNIAGLALCKNVLNESKNDKEVDISVVKNESQNTIICLLVSIVSLGYVLVVYFLSYAMKTYDSLNKKPSVISI